MAKHLVQDTSLTAIADAIRAKTGGTEPLMFPGGMTEAIAGITGGEDLDAELATQDELIDQIFTAIDEKSAAISSGGGEPGGGGYKQSEVYDFVVIPRTELVYTVPRDGALFILSDFNPEGYGFEMQIRKSHQIVRGYSNYSGSVRNICVGKKNVVSGETIAVSSVNGYGCLILAESGSNVVDCFRTVRKVPATGADLGVCYEPFTINTERNSGFCYLSASLSATSMGLHIEDGKSKAAFMPYETKTMGWGAPGYLTGVADEFSFKLDEGYYTPNSFQLMSFNLSADGAPVYDIDLERVYVARATMKDFKPDAEWSVISSVDGYMVFVGAYRKPNDFPLDGFTVLKEYETTVSDTSQTMVIAYKAVTNGEEVIIPATSERFGGTFYETTADLSKANLVVGNATRGSENIVYPMPDEYDAMFGIVGFIMGTNSVGDANVHDIYTLKESVAGRLTTFYANDFTGASGASDISFPYAETDDYPNDVRGIWAKFTFAD